MIAENDRRVLESGQAIAVEEFLSSAVDYAWSLVVRFPVLGADQQQARIGGFDIDITEQKRAAERLQKSERRFRDVTHHHPVPVVFIDRRTRQLIIANPAFREIMGVGPHDEERFRRHRWFATREDYQRIDALSRRQTRVDGVETHLRHLDGSVFPVSLSWRHIEMDDRPVIVGSILDLTATKAAEAELARSREALAQSERLNALGSLLAGVSHELNNPLGGRRRADPGAGGAAGRHRACATGGQDQKRRRPLRPYRPDLPRDGAQRQPERRSTDVNDLIRAVLDIAAYGLRTAGVEVECRLANGLPALDVDPDQMHQVLFNLIVNAQHALQEMPAPRRIEIETSREGDDVQIVIADNGPGVPAEIRSRIFDPFFTTKAQGSGTGIGLSFSLGVVQAHNGRLDLLEHSDGAHFRVLLPVEATLRRRQSKLLWRTRALALVVQPLWSMTSGRSAKQWRSSWRPKVLSSRPSRMARAPRQRSWGVFSMRSFAICGCPISTAPPCSTGPVRQSRASRSDSSSLPATHSATLQRASLNGLVGRYLRSRFRAIRFVRHYASWQTCRASRLLVVFGAGQEGRCFLLSHAVARQQDAMGVVDDPVENGVGDAGLRPVGRLYRAMRTASLAFPAQR